MSAPNTQRHIAGNPYAQYVVFVGIGTAKRSDESVMQLVPNIRM